MTVHLQNGDSEITINCSTTKTPKKPKSSRPERCCTSCCESIYSDRECRTCTDCSNSWHLSCAMVYFPAFYAMFDAEWMVWYCPSCMDNSEKHRSHFARGIFEFLYDQQVVATRKTPILNRRNDSTNSRCKCSVCLYDEEKEINEFDHFANLHDCDSKLVEECMRQLQKELTE